MRERCTGCGAAVSFDALTCEYCGTASPHAVRAKQAASEADLAAEEARLADAQKAVERSSTYALVWSLVGLVTCCLPIPAGIGLAMGLKARGRAKESGWVAPGNATAAVVISTIGLLMFIAFAILVGVEMQAVSERKAELHTLVEAESGKKELTQHTACALAELRLLEDGYDGTSGNIIMDHFECAGRLERDGDRAVLKEISIKKGSSKPRLSLDACLTRGARWHVTEIVGSGERCPK